ncbi:pumilio domain protein C56F2 [Gigaspora margarita]|uniref:Pumilio domain protein C56F2 n=1 Tax=Gigaspora margarita TaxID=4874 RepID=A0A8H3WZR0_GIGMA|nr:pumilio domain protein C56F2 [Gigaspora margarita]
MASQQSEMGKDSFASAVTGNSAGGSPQHETRYLTSKRAREIQAEEGITTSYRSGPLPPPSISTNGAFNNGTLLSDSTASVSLEYLNLKSVGKVSPTPSSSGPDHLSSYSSSYRRTRADTLPSSLSRPIVGHHPTSSLSITTSIGSSASAATLLTPPKASSRLRSGSLTLPSASLSAAFGPSIFTSGWSDHRSETNGPPTPPMQTPTTGDLLRGDENNTVGKTLDYLGLDDHEHLKATGNLPQIKVDMKSSNSQNYQPSVGSIPSLPSLRRDANRIRSYSVSATAKYDDPPPTTTVSSNNLFPPGSAAVQQFHQTHSRPRAISLGILDLPNDIMHMRQGRNGQMYNDLSESGQGSTTPSRSLGGEQLVGMMLLGAMEGKKKQQQQIHMDDDYLLPDHDELEHARSGVSSPHDHTPDHSQQSTPPPQTPTRSLWIGNIDPNLSTQDLMQLFSPYGSIESLRLLPDKECGFVNFVRVEDAVRAKDDIMNRMGSRVGNCIVRVGYGKADSLNSHDLSPSSQTQLQPTRALWIGNIPTSTTPQILQNIFSPFGLIESARVLTHKNCGFVNFEKLDDAVKAKKALHGKEVLGSAVGPVRIGFAKVQPKPSPTSTPEPGSPATRHIRNLSSSSSSSNNQNSGQWNGQVENYHNSMMRMMMSGAANVSGGLTEKQLMMRELSGGVDDDIDDVNENRPPTTYFTSIPPVGDPNPNRKPDASRLREIRKRLDSGHCSAKEVEAIASEVLEECVELSSDYIGNTVIQKLFERCSENTKTKMLEKIAPHLATIGIHKNGTWAAQKIIDCAKTPAQMQLITSNVKPYTPPLLLDQFGNYVVQCCLRLSPQRNQFIFDAMVDRCWEIAQGRFGARAMRACLESQHVTKKQQKQVAIAIVMNAVPLSTNPNGALLLTWMLDTSSFPGRYRILAPRLAPHLAHLCTHKLASLTVLKIINQRQESDARDLTITSLFFSANDQILEDVLSDQVHGVGVVQKVLASPYVDSNEKQRLAEKVKIVLGKLKVQQVQGYKRLMEELGMVGDPALGAPTMNSGPSPVGIPQGQQNSSESSTLNSGTQSSTPMASTPTATYTTSAPMFMNNMPMSPHPHSPFPPTSPYPHMSPFTPFIHPSTLAAVAAGMYGHPAMFNPAAYPYMLAASGAIPPPIVGTTPHTQVSSSMPNNQMLAFLQQQQQLLQQQQQQHSQPQEQRSPSVGSDAQAHTSPQGVISESLSPSSIGHVEVQQQ